MLALVHRCGSGAQVLRPHSRPTSPLLEHLCNFLHTSFYKKGILNLHKWHILYLIF